MSNNNFQQGTNISNKQGESSSWIKGLIGTMIGGITVTLVLHFYFGIG